MSQTVAAEVFTPEEVARAVGADVETVSAAMSLNGIGLIPATQYLAGADALRVARLLRRRGVPDVRPGMFSGVDESAAARRGGLPAAASSAVHSLLVAAALWFSAGAVQTETTVTPPEPARLVFIVSPGPGGGGGGGGLRNPVPARPVARRTPAPQHISVPAAPPTPVALTPAPEPLPSRALVAPVVATAADAEDHEGVVEDPREAPPSQGPGAGGGAGTGQGTGAGEGTGSGIGEGAGGGTGGGPYRPGSGIDPPRLLREVKAVYTEEARRRGITGDVLLEIIVRGDGSVGEISVRRGLGAGLDERAIEAVRQWRFAPARRLGRPVDVIVGVAVEFTLR